MTLNNTHVKGKSMGKRVKGLQKHGDLETWPLCLCQVPA